MTSLRRSSLVFASMLALACGEGDVVVQPAAAGAASGGSAGAAGSAPRGGGGGAVASGGSAGAAGAPVGPVIRTVETRKPFGNLEKGNLLWDGDLEWNGPFVSQYSWVATSMTGPGFGGGDVTFLTGPQCRSGLKCAALTNNGLAAIGVAPTTPFTHARAWVRVPAGVACADVAVRVEGCFFEATGAPPLDAVAASPDTKGWCRYEGDRPTPDDAVCLYFKAPAGASGDFVVDDAFVGAGATGKAQRAFAPPSADVLADVAEMQAAVRARVHRMPVPFAPPMIRTHR